MKIYVTGFDLKPEYEEAMEKGKPLPAVDNYEIFFNVKPLWSFHHREMAEMELSVIQSMSIHVGDHYRELEVEQLMEDLYAIVCNDHPQPIQ